MADTRERRKERLSSLPDALLIETISLLPLESAIITDALSRRWRHLWTHSFAFSFDKLTPGFFKTFDQIMHKFTLPFIHTFTIEFKDVYDLSNHRIVLVDSWLRQICQRNVRHLNLAFPNCCNPNVYRSLGRIFEINSLVSIKLSPEFAFDSDSIKLPHLKKLDDIYLVSSQCEWLNKLISVCPLLEELSFIFRSIIITGNETFFVNCSSPNLRRLSIKSASSKHGKVFIDAPKLEYLFARAPNSSSFFFGDKPVSLQQADIQLWDEHVNDVTGLSSTLYQEISNVRILTDHSQHFNVFNTSSAFPNLTRLTLIMKWYDNCKGLLKFLSLCPLLDVLILNFGFKNIVTNDERWVIPTETTLGRLKRIEIVTSNVLDYEHYQYFSELVRYVLRSTSSLEHLHISIDGGRKQGKGIANNDGKSHEYMLCNLIYKCRMASKKCGVVFIGKYLVMSRKAGARHATICYDSHLH